MAKTQKAQGGSTPVVPNFKDVDKATTQAAMSAVMGGRQDPLVVPANAAQSEDKKGTKYSRWTERSVVQQAYRTVTKSKLMDVVVLVKIRQGDKNNGRKVFSHFYINNAENISQGHESMNERSIGSIGTLLVATGFMPAGGVLKGTLLDKMFPQKGQPGTASPLVSKRVVANVLQTFGAKKDQKTNQPMKDDEGNIIKERRDSVESFLPDTEAAAPVADEDEDEGEEEGEEDES